MFQEHKLIHIFYNKKNNMITYFSEQDMVSFGNFLLSPKRKEAYLEHNLEEEQITQALLVINPLDLTSWFKEMQQRSIQNTQENNTNVE